jgi:hypothetical protein
MAVRFREDLLALEEHLELLTAVAALIAIVVERLAAGEGTGCSNETGGTSLPGEPS